MRTVLAKGDGFEVSAADGPVSSPGFITRARAYFERVFKRDRVEPAELWLSGAVWLCGGILSLPFDTLSSSAGFRALAGIAPEWVWTVATLAVPAMLLVAGLRRSYLLRLLAAFAHMQWFIFVGVLFCKGNPVGFGLVFVYLGFVELHTLYRLGRGWEEYTADTPLHDRIAAGLARVLDAQDWIIHRRLRAALYVRGLFR